MRDSKRNYPDINFVTNEERDTSAVINKLVTAYETFTGRKLYPADPARLFILWIADIIVQERIIVNESAKQNVPRYANDEFLDSLGELFKDVERLGAQAAQTTLRFFISAVQPTTLVIVKGTRVTVDGEITFETTENLNIAPGALYGDVAAVCITTTTDPNTGEEVTIGTAANGFLPGQIAQIVDPFPYFARVENLTESGGGADRESDDAYYVRMGESMESFSTAGPMGAYVYWAKTASPKITDVKPTSPEPGVADIRVLCEGGELPDEEIINKVYDALKSGDDGVRPFTDQVIVLPPDVIPYDIDIIFYIPKPRQNSATIIMRDVGAAVQAYRTWQSERMGLDINPDELRYLLMAAGIKRVTVNAPEFTVVGETSVAALNRLNVVYGGIEDE